MGVSETNEVLLVKHILKMPVYHVGMGQGCIHCLGHGVALGTEGKKGRKRPHVADITECHTRPRLPYQGTLRESENSCVTFLSLAPRLNPN